jgi:CCR4-NOT transcription complex subunit 6
VRASCGSGDLTVHLCAGHKHAESDKHAYAPSHITEWYSRKQRLVEKLARLDADILCLQEVTELGLQKTFVPELAKLGYKCAGFSLGKDPRKKPPASVTAPVKYDHWSIGCATFCKSNVTEVIASKRVYLKDFMPAFLPQAQLLQLDIRSKDSTMVMMLAKINGHSKPVLVANTHLFWDPRRADIKAMQAYAAMNAIQKLLATYSYGEHNPVPVVLCGDFNSMPVRDDVVTGTERADDCDEGHLRSGVHELLTTGRLSELHPEHPDTWYSRVLTMQQSPQLGPLQTHAPLTNTFCVDEFAPYAPAFSTKTNEFQGWLDHIWVNDQVTVTHKLVPPVCQGHPNAQELSQQYPPLPNVVSTALVCFYSETL